MAMKSEKSSHTMTQVGDDDVDVGVLEHADADRQLLRDNRHDGRRRLGRAGIGVRGVVDELMSDDCGDVRRPEQEVVLLEVWLRNASAHQRKRFGSETSRGRTGMDDVARVHVVDCLQNLLHDDLGGPDGEPAVAGGPRQGREAEAQGLGHDARVAAVRTRELERVEQAEDVAAAGVGLVERAETLEHRDLVRPLVLALCTERPRPLAVEDLQRDQTLLPASSRQARTTTLIKAKD